MAKRSKHKKKTIPKTRVETRAASIPSPAWLVPLERPSSPWIILILGLLIVGAVLAIYVPSLHTDWLWDDDLYVFRNPLIYDPHRLWKIWFDPGSFIEYYPIDATLTYIQWRLFHLNTFGYHVTNVTLHLTSALLVWRFLQKLGLRFAWIGGLLFAIHPTMVESVAWISELKNTLSMPPFLLAMIFYLEYDAHRRRRDYFLALALFVVSMLCKINMTSFPIILLIYAWWKRGRITWADFADSIPFFIISLVLGALTVMAGIWFRERQMQPPDITLTTDFFSRFLLAGVVAFLYLLHAVWPVNLLPVYPQWTVDPGAVWQYLPWVAFVALVIVLWLKRRTWGRHGLLALSFFFLPLLPFLGFKGVSYMSFTYVMDHFLYFPVLGLIVLVVAGIDAFEKRLRPAAVAPFVAAVTIVIGLLFWEGVSYGDEFSNSFKLWSYTVDRNPDAWPAQNNMANMLEVANPAAAIPHYQKSIQTKPYQLDAHYDLGTAYYALGRIPDAIKEFKYALLISPYHAPSHENLGLIYLDQNRIQEAVAEFETALKSQPGFPEALYNLGNAKMRLNQLPEAIHYFQESIRLAPQHIQSYNNLGICLARLNRLDEARDAFEAGLRVNPNYTEARTNLAILQAQMAQAGHPVPPAKSMGTH